MNDRDKYPFVSVIIPVYNGEDVIGECLRALIEQSYPGKRFEVIVADNGSADGTIGIAQGFPTVKIVEEREIRSSYAARNKAVRVATGDIFAFTDADCIPDSDWLSRGIEYFLQNDIPIFGGRIDFVFSEKRGWCERFDALYHMNQKETVKRGRVATANLFVTREFFGRIGFFRGNLISGGDSEWSHRAVEKGFEFGYCDSAVVRHPTRKGLRENITKEKRIGKGEGQIKLLKKGGRRRYIEILKLILTFPFDIIHYVWPVVKFVFQGKIRLYEPVFLIPIAKLMFFAKRIGTIGYLLHRPEE
ncbi:glycosyl transferase [bacterium]|nr:MAG: glycosyl transferase [bacterium]